MGEVFLVASLMRAIYSEPEAEQPAKLVECAKERKDHRERVCPKEREDHRAREGAKEEKEDHRTREGGAREEDHRVRECGREDHHARGAEVEEGGSVFCSLCSLWERMTQISRGYDARRQTTPTTTRTYITRRVDACDPNAARNLSATTGLGASIASIASIATRGRTTNSGPTRMRIIS